MLNSTVVILGEEDMFDFDIDFSALIPKAIGIVIVAVISIVLVKIIQGVAKKIRAKKELDKERNTMIRLVANTLKGVVIALAVISVLQICGVNVSGTVAGLGVAGIIVSFALQDYLKDIMSGMGIINDKFFMIGDVIEYDGEMGVVVQLSLKTTKIQLIKDDSIMTISNRLIDHCRKYPASFPVPIEVPLPYDVTPEQADISFRRIEKLLAEIEDVESARYDGLYSFGDSALIYRFVMKCDPRKKYFVSCRCHRCIYDELLKDNIAIPFNTVNVVNEVK